MTKNEKITIFLPLLGFLLYVLYLVFLSPRPFLLRWIEGCFSLFVALVFCNLLRRRFADRR
jgi:hypothetical protein